MKAHTISHIFKTAATSLLLAGAIHVGSAYANSNVLQPTQTIEDIIAGDPLAIEILENIIQKSQEHPDYYNSRDNRAHVVQAANDIDKIVRQLQNGSILPGRKLAELTATLMLHNNPTIADLAGWMGFTLSEKNEEYLSIILPALEKYDDRYFMPIMREALIKFPSLHNEVFRIIDDILEHGDADKIFYVTITLKGTFYKDILNPPDPEQTINILLKHLEKVQNNPRAIEDMLSCLTEAVKRHESLPLQQAQSLFETATTFNTDPEITGDDALYLMAAITEKHAQFAKELADISAPFISEQYDNSLREAALFSVITAGRSDQSLRQQTINMLMTLSKETTKPSIITYFSTRALGDIGRDSQEDRAQIYDHLTDIINTSKELGGVILSLGYLGEADEQYARTAFDFAREILETGHHHGEKADTFEIAYAIEVISAIATTHHSFTSESFDVLTKAMENEDVGGWYHDQLVPIAYRGLVEIGSVQDDFAKHVIDYAAATSTRYGPQVNFIGSMGLKNCAALDYARETLKTEFTSKATTRSAEEIETANKVLLNIKEKTGNDTQTCQKNLDNEKLQNPSNSNISTYFVFMN